MSKKLKLPKAPLRLDLGAGRNPQPGFTSVDLFAPGVDVKCDLTKFPWPWKDESVDEIYCSHFLEHIDRTIRWRFMEECWRILKPESVMRIIVPSWKSERSLGDMTHIPPAVVPMFFFYLNKSWREANKLTYGPYDIKCNFEHQCGPAGVSDAFSNRAHDAMMFALTHYFESFQDIWCTITKKPL
jgi:hypothetical protein